MQGDTIRNSFGNVAIADTAIAAISSIAALKVPGVVELRRGLVESIAGIFGTRMQDRGVKVNIQDKTVDIDVYLIIEYGSEVSEIAWKVQEKIRESVESMTGLTVNAVNVIIQGVTVSRGGKKE